jgi:hypothetical protein
LKNFQDSPIVCIDVYRHWPNQVVDGAHNHVPQKISLFANTPWFQLQRPPIAMIGISKMEIHPTGYIEFFRQVSLHSMFGAI